MRTQIQAVLFDYGGVFTEAPSRVLRRMAQDIGAPPRQLFEVIFGPSHADSDHPWHRLERGELTLVEAREQIMQLGRQDGLEADPFTFLEGMGAGGGGVREEVSSCVREVRADGRRTALVTNNAVEFRAYWRKSLPLDELFDAVIDSSEVGMRKPDPGIFHLTLDRLGGIEPQRSVLLDDFNGNIEAARAVGMHGVLVGEDPRPALQELRALLRP
jgi:epoxide hydrolase-like predicted phosphatase